MARYTWGVVCAALLVSALSAQEPVRYTYEDETFTIRPHPKSEYCFEMSYKDTVAGAVGVWPGGTPERPYGYNMGADACNSRGLRGGNVGYPTIEECLENLARLLLGRYQEAMAQEEFDPDKEAAEMRDFIRSIPRRAAPSQVPDSAKQ